MGWEKLNRQYFEGSGYTERSIHQRIDRFGRIAHVLSTCEAQRRNVESVLRDLGLETRLRDATLEVLNKADLLSPDDRDSLAAQAERRENAVLCSALTGAGCEDVIRSIDVLLQRDLRTRDVILGHEEGALLAWLYRRGEVVARRDDETGVNLTVRMALADWRRFDRRRGEAAEDLGAEAG